VNERVHDKDTEKVEEEDAEGDGHGDGVLREAFVLVPGVVEEKEKAHVHGVETHDDEPGPEEAGVLVPGPQHEEEAAEEADESVLADVLDDGAAQLVVHPQARVREARVVLRLVVEPDCIDEGDEDGEEGLDEAEDED